MYLLTYSLNLTNSYHNKDLYAILITYLNTFLCELRVSTADCYLSWGLLPVGFWFLWPEWQFPGLSSRRTYSPSVTNVLVHLILICVFSHEQLVLEMFVNTRVLCVLLKPGADKCNHYSINFSFCTVSFKILTCHLRLTGEAVAHADEIQKAWSQRHGTAWMAGAVEYSGGLLWRCVKSKQMIKPNDFSVLSLAWRGVDRWKCNHTGVFW